MLFGKVFFSLSSQLFTMTGKPWLAVSNRWHFAWNIFILSVNDKETKQYTGYGTHFNTTFVVPFITNVTYYRSSITNWIIAFTTRVFCGTRIWFNSTQTQQQLHHGCNWSTTGILIMSKIMSNRTSDYCTIW